MRDSWLAVHMEEASNDQSSFGRGKVGKENQTANGRGEQAAKITELTDQFDALLKKDLIPVPAGFYDEELFNDDVQYVSEIFG